MEVLTPSTSERRQAWLEARRTMLGGSDAAVVAGLSPWKTPLELYFEKRGEVPLEHDEVPERMHWGNVLEDAIAQEYSRRTGRDVRRAPALLRSKQYPFIGANIDRKIVGERRGLEVKNVSEHSFRQGEWGEDGTAQVPDHYNLQVQHYLFVTGYDEFDLAALVGGNALKIYTIPRDEDVIKHLVTIERMFWERVEQGRPPEADYAHASAVELMKKRYPGTNGEVIDLPAEAQALHEELQAIKEAAKAASAREDEIKARLLDMMGESGGGRLPAGGGYTRRMVAEKETSYVRKPYVDFRFSPKL